MLFKFKRASFVVLLLALSVSVPASQEQEKDVSILDGSQYMISAKAGVINAVEGDVEINAGLAGKESWKEVLAGDNASRGDTIRTQATGRAEILLNPGSYLRLAANSEVILIETDIQSITVSISRGSALIEASALDGPIWVSGPGSDFTIAKPGLYRFNVIGSDIEARVHRGRLLTGRPVSTPELLKEPENGRIVVKESKRIFRTGDAWQVAAFDKRFKDALDTWSHERAKIIIAANRALSSKILARSYADSARSLWVYNQSFHCFTLVPIYWAASSPYGYRYRHCRNYPHDPFIGRRREDGKHSGGSSNGSGWANGGGGSGGKTGGGASTGRGTAGGGGASSGDTGGRQKDGVSFGGNRSQRPKSH